MEEPRVLSTNQWPSDLGWSEGYSRKGVGPTLELGVVVEVLHQHLQTIGMLVLSVPIQYIHLSSHERSEISDFSADIMHGREEEQKGAIDHPMNRRRSRSVKCKANPKNVQHYHCPAS